MARVKHQPLREPSMYMTTIIGMMVLDLHRTLKADNHKIGKRIGYRDGSQVGRIARGQAYMPALRAQELQRMYVDVVGKAAPSIPLKELTAYSDRIEDDGGLPPLTVDQRMLQKAGSKGKRPAPTLPVTPPPVEAPAPTEVPPFESIPAGPRPLWPSGQVLTFSEASHRNVEERSDNGDDLIDCLHKLRAARDMTETAIDAVLRAMSTHGVKGW